MNFLLAFESWEKWCVSNIFSIHIRRKRTSLLFTDISDTYSRHMHWMSLKVSLRVSEIMSHSGEAFSVFPVSLQNTGLICFSEWVQRPVVVLANALAVRHRCVHVHVWSTPHEMAGRRYVIILLQVSESHFAVECKKKCRSSAGNRRRTFGSGWEWSRCTGSWTWNLAPVQSKLKQRMGSLLQSTPSRTVCELVCL